MLLAGHYAAWLPGAGLPLAPHRHDIKAMIMREIAWIRLLSTSGEKKLGASRRPVRHSAGVARRLGALPDFWEAFAIYHLIRARRRSVDGEFLRASRPPRAGHSRPWGASLSVPVGGPAAAH